MRFASDLLRADATLSLRALKALDSIRQKYGIRREDEAKGETITLQEALQTLRRLPESARHDILGDFRHLDDTRTCNTKERELLWLALVACLNGEQHGNASVHSAYTPHCICLDSSQVLYVEGEYDQETNREIELHYREIATEFRLMGFDFAYLPRVATHYASLPEADMRAALTILHPSSTEEQIECARQELTASCSARRLCARLISALDLKALSLAPPSFLFRISRSVVGGKDFENYLAWQIDNGALTTVRHIADTAATLTQAFPTDASLRRRQGIAIHGFYKLLMDSLVCQHKVRSSVVIDFVRGDILLPEINGRIEGLHRREKALYALFLFEMPGGGINFNKPSDHMSLEKYNRRMETIQRKYELIYKNFGGERQKAPHLESPVL